MEEKKSSKNNLKRKYLRRNLWREKSSKKIWRDSISEEIFEEKSQPILFWKIESWKEKIVEKQSEEKVFTK